MESKLGILYQGIRLGKLVLLDEGPYAWRQKTNWLCDCGKTSLKITGNVLNGITSTCGRCLEISSEEMAARKFGKLRIKTPQTLTSGSAKKVVWVCDCGREASIRVDGVIGGIKSCGHCSDMPISELHGKHFGKLCLIDARGAAHISPESHKRLLWQCDCGKTTEVQARYVLNGTTSTCGRCNELSIELLTGKKFGRLRMRDPHVVKANSNKKVWWVCDCGREIFSKVFAVTRGNTRSCGRCYLSYRQRWNAEKDEIRKLRTPIMPRQLPDWLPKALEPITKTSQPFKAQCRLCGGEYFPRWSGIRLGKSLTCGCSVSQVSSGQNEVFEFVKSLGVEAEMEHEINSLSYDIWVPSKNLAVEFNGLKWHSRSDSKRRDIEKWKNAVRSGVDYLMIFEDEWALGRHKVESLLRNRLGTISQKALRPQECKVNKIDRKMADEFYGKHHYIGKAAAPANYGVFFQEQLIACCSFKRPTRQSSHPWELARMVGHPGFRVHGIWSKIMKLFAAEHLPSSVVSFSDNRLFDGQVYSKIGFQLDGDVNPDYYWMKGNRRLHKSKLRKTNDERASGKTEVELREAQGYKRIWDLGKKRWVWRSEQRKPGDPTSSGTERQHV